MGVESPYYSASQVILFINGFLVDDACCLNYAVQDEKIPIYGYNDRDWRTVVPGKSMVQGNIDIHFRYHGYLTDVINTTRNQVLPDNVRQLASIKRVRNIDQDLSAFRDFNRPADLESKREMFEGIFRRQQEMGDRDPEVTDWANTTLSQLKKLYWGEQNRNDIAFSDPGNRTRPGRATGRTGFDIMVRFGNLNGLGDTRTTLLLEDVHVIGQSVPISSTVPDGGSPIKESYPFIARTIRPYLGGRR